MKWRQAIIVMGTNGNWLAQWFDVSFGHQCWFVCVFCENCAICCLQWWAPIWLTVKKRCFVLGTQKLFLVFMVTLTGKKWNSCLMRLFYIRLFYSVTKILLDTSIVFTHLPKLVIIEPWLNTSILCRAVSFNQTALCFLPWYKVTALSTCQLLSRTLKWQEILQALEQMLKEMATGCLSVSKKNTFNNRLHMDFESINVYSHSTLTDITILVFPIRDKKVCRTKWCSICRFDKMWSTGLVRTADLFLWLIVDGTFPLKIFIYEPRKAYI